MSIKNQTFEDYELIIINDGSDEIHTRIIKDSISQFSPDARYYYQENMGVSIARNNGVKKAKGDYICFVDADDTILPNYLQESYAIAIKHNADFVIGSNIRSIKKYRERNIPTKIYRLNHYQRMKFRIHMIGDVLYWSKNGEFVGRGPVSRLLRKEIALQTPFHKELKMAEDIVWNLELLDKCENICVTKQVWYIYRNNMQSANNKPSVSAIIEAEKGLLSIKECIDLSNRRELASYYRRMFQDINRLYSSFLRNYNGMHINSHLLFIEKVFRTRYPWKAFLSINTFALLDHKLKVQWVLYKCNLWFLILKVMQKKG